MRIHWITIGLLLSVPAFAESLKIENTRIWSAPDNTRVVFDLSAAAEHRLETLTNPERLVIDIKNISHIPHLKQPKADDKYLLRIRSGRYSRNDLRIVFDLKTTVQPHSFILKPHSQYGHRLVVDMKDKSQRQASPLSVRAETATRKPRDIIVAIDAGHGGEDPGAKGTHGTFEKDITLQIAKRLAKFIDQQPGMQAVLIRKSDYFIRLRERIKKARQNKADLFVSIHADAFKDPRVKGSSVYILSNTGASSEAAKWLAERENRSDLIGGVSLDDKDDMLASVLLDLSQTASLEASIDIAEHVLGTLKKIGKTHKSSVQSAGFAVLKSPDIPSILIETAYISNPQEEKKLRDPIHQRKLATAILKGIKKYFNERPLEGTLFASKAQRKHEIALGDTLSTIAKRYNVSTVDLRTINKLDSDHIQVGQVLTIPSI